MVPEDDEGVPLAKKICVECPVTAACLAAAEQLTVTHGADYAQGIWGGLTLRERATWMVLDRVPRPCAECGLVCVPINNTTDRCSSCHPEARLHYDEYRSTIEGLFAAGCTFQQAAQVLRVKQNSLTAACYRWQLEPGTPSARGRKPVQECGTLAAKTRHLRHGESWDDCACRHTPWKKGESRSSKNQTPVNAH